MTHDPINRPSHYAEGRMFEPIDVIEDWELSFGLGNSLKYISRVGRKSNDLEDLYKASWYLNREITKLENEQKIEENVSNLSGSISDLTRRAQGLFSVNYQDILNAYDDDLIDDNLLNEYGVRDADPKGFDRDELWDPTLGPIET